METMLSIPALKSAYAEGRLTPRALMARIYERAKEFEGHNVWIKLLTEAELEPYFEALERMAPEEHPLWGIPFAIKDNIDLEGIATTAACPEFAYTAQQSAKVVNQLLAAGAIPVGKTNLDQFATGLNGTRSPYGACRNAFDPDYISGGSSSGSAVAVALGMASFSLGTDTAGSGRVPACFNNLVGVKPTKGLLSATGVVPACKSLDCVSIFALDADQANLILAITEGEDSQDSYSRSSSYTNSARLYGEHQGPLVLGVPSESMLRFFGDETYEASYRSTLKALETDGVVLREIDYSPFDEAARLLYEGPWVAERFLACESMLEANPEAIEPVVRSIVSKGDQPSAAELFRAQYRLEALRKIARTTLEGIDALLTPTAGRHFTIEEILEEPIKRNSELGYYTNFMNLLDLASLAVPTAFTEEKRPFGVTLVSTAFRDRPLLSMAKRFERIFDLPLGTDKVSPARDRGATTVEAPDPRWIDVLVCGAHLEGLPLNWQLLERGARLKAKTLTSANYRFFALAGGPPMRPGLVRTDQDGAAIEVEIWSVPAAEFGTFVAGIPAPLGIGKVEIASGEWVTGFICEPRAVGGATDITEFGGWRPWMAQKKN